MTLKETSPESKSVPSSEICNKQVEKPDWFTKEGIIRRAQDWLGLTEQEQDETLWWIGQSPNAAELKAEWIYVVDTFEAKRPRFEDSDPYLREEARETIMTILADIPNNTLLSSKKCEEVQTALHLLSQWGDLGVPIDKLREMYNLEDHSEHKSVNTLIDTLNIEFAKQDGLLQFSVEIMSVPIYNTSGELIEREVIKLLPKAPTYTSAEHTD